ncbi:MAG TPA: T9SS type A sorting domain-containing protein [Prolixibacteraceae bacterium]|nr:T9SS type A sorting domain-containing protein [Prolixibacteraceae bacterium]
MKVLMNWAIFNIALFCVYSLSAQQINMIHDINKSENIGSSPYSFTSFNNEIYFVARDAYLGECIWSVSKNLPPKIVTPQKGFRQIEELCEYNNKLYFIAFNDSMQRELWSYTPQQGFVVEDIGLSTKIVERYFFNLTVFNDKLCLFLGEYYFENDREVYSILEYDGQNVTQLLEMPNVDEGFSLRGDATVANNKLYFSAFQNDKACLWAYDGSSSPYRVDEFFENADHEVRSLRSFENVLYYLRHDNLIGKEFIVRFDGENEPVDLVIEYERPRLVGVLDSFLYLIQDFELWKYNIDGTGSVAFDHADFQGLYSSDPFMQSDSLLYFFAIKNQQNQLFWFDGVNEPVALVELDFSPRMVRSAFLFENSIFINADDEIHGSELWQVDIENQKVNFFDLNQGTLSSGLTQFCKFNNKLYFSAAYGNNYVYKLWEYNGVDEPAMLELDPDNQLFLPANFKVFNEQLFFSAQHPEFGIELMMYDGVNPPIMLADIREGGAWSSPEAFTDFNHTLFFSARNDSCGRELFALDSNNVPYVFYDVWPGEFGSNVAHLQVFDNKLYFSAATLEHGDELWVYDGQSNPHIVADIKPGNKNFHPRHLIVFDNKLWFYANDSSNVYSIWNYDGQNLPQRVFDLTVSETKMSPMAVFNNELFFCAGDSISGVELYKYNGSGQPVLMLDINPGTQSSSPKNLSALTDRLLFSANDGINGSELWEYLGDGSPVMLADLFQGIEHSSPSGFIEFDCKIIFSAYDISVGREMWEYIPEPVIHIEEITSCGSFVTGGGQVIDQSGVYTHTFTNSVGCDSIVELHLTVIDLNTQVEQNNNVLTALAEGAAFQWVDCNNNNAPVDGANQAQFTASENGNYAVEVTVGDCSLLSDCLSVTGVGFSEYTDEYNVMLVYPNPSVGKITLDVGPNYQGAYWELTDMKGSQIKQKQINSRLSEIDLGTNKGIYFITVFKNGEHTVKKVKVE